MIMVRGKTSGGADRSVNDPTAKGKGPPRPAGRTRAPSRTEAVHEALRQAIIEQKLRPGAKLPEDAIGETFGTSRTIAREALGRLAVEGLVDLLPNRGAFVANPSLEEAHDAFLVRRSLERTVAECLAGRLTPEARAILQAHVEREKAVAGNNEAESIRLAGEFHLVLARLTERPLLIRYVTEVVSRCSLILAMYARPHSADCGASEHEEILAALVEGDAARAADLMGSHLDHVAGRALLKPPPDTDVRHILAPFAERLRASEGR